MNSKNKPGSINAFDFDLGLGSNGGSKPLRDQKTTNQTSYSQPKPNTTSFWTNQPNKPAWTHQPVGSLSGPASMVGDIFGKSWNSSASSTSTVSGVGIVNGKNPNLFSDLLGSGIGQSKGSANVPLKNVGQGAFSMGGVADSMPKYGNSGTSSVGSMNVGSNYGRSTSLGSGGANSMNSAASSMKSMGGSGIGGSCTGSKKDPFGSLVDFSTKKNGSLNSASNGSGSGNDSFGTFQNATAKPSNVAGSGFGKDPFGDFQNATAKPSNSGSGFGKDPFGEFQNAPAKPSNSASGFGKDPFGEFQNAPAKPKADPLGDFGFPNSQEQSRATAGNDYGAMFDLPSDGGFKGSEDTANQQFDFGTGDDGAATTELEGLPPPPAGVNAATAKSKGTDNYKQGQFADAIKWLSWAVVLYEKSGDHDSRKEVLTCRASCYKEVGEYKKAVADCTKVLDHDGKNVSVLVQRALLYESMEKYKLGAEDLRTVMNLDPGNRLARSTIHRLTKMADL